MNGCETEACVLGVYIVYSQRVSVQLYVSDCENKLTLEIKNGYYTGSTSVNPSKTHVIFSFYLPTWELLSGYDIGVVSVSELRIHVLWVLVTRVC